MSEPIVFITTMQIHDGQVEVFKTSVAKAMAFLEANGPQVLAGVYLDEEAGLANGLQVHRNSDSILALWKLADPYIREVMEHVTTTKVEIYGQPSEPVMEGMRRLSGTGASLVMRPRVAGFAHFDPAAADLA